MPCTPSPTSESKKIRLHSPFLHAQLPQMLPKVQYARRSKTLPSKSILQDSSVSAKTDPPTSPASVFHTQTNPLPANSTTPIRKTYHLHQQFHVLVPLFKHHRCLAAPGTPSHSLTTLLQTKLSLLPLLECVTTSTVATRMSSKLKRSFELVAPSNTKEHPVKTKKPRCSLHGSSKYDNWNLDLSRLPLRHQHLLTSPF